MNEQKVERRSVVIALGIICIILIASLLGVIAIYTSMLSGKNNTVSSLNSQISDQNDTISYLNSQIKILQDQVSNFTRIVNLLETAIWLDNENVSLEAGGFANWTFYPYYSGVVRITLQTTCQNPWVEVSWAQYYYLLSNTVYDQLATASNGLLGGPLGSPNLWWAEFPVIAYTDPNFHPVNANAVLVKVGNNSTLSANAEITIEHLY